MPVLTGLEAIPLIKQISPSIIVICWSATFQQDIFKILSIHKNVIYCEKETGSILYLIDKYLNEGPDFYPGYIEEWKKKSEKQINDLLQPRKINFTSIELTLMKLSYEGFTNKKSPNKCP